MNRLNCFLSLDLEKKKQKFEYAICTTTDCLCGIPFTFLIDFARMKNCLYKFWQKKRKNRRQRNAHAHAI